MCSRLSKGVDFQKEEAERREGGFGGWKRPCLVLSCLYRIGRLSVYIASVVYLSISHRSSIYLSVYRLGILSYHLSHDESFFASVLHLSLMDAEIELSRVG